MRRVFVAEKPSLGRAIAQGLGKCTPGDGCIYAGGDVVTWCFGHILEQCSPEEYDEKYKAWRIEDLPILPSQWKMKVKKGAEKQYKVIRALVKDADEIVNAGDPDREGQLLVDEVLNELGVLRTKPIRRILLNALDEKSVAEALRNLHPNEEFVGLRNSALARSRADWLIGMNLSRIYTIRARAAGYPNTVSVGRVQTPTMGLVVRREIEIRQFRPVTFFTPRIVWQHANGTFLTKWKTREMDGVDAEGHIIDRDVADRILLEGKNSAASVHVEQKKGTSAQRLPYSLSALQIEAGKKFGYSPQDVLDTQQSLYEKKYTSYPRSDCDYLPENQLADKETILKNLASLGAPFSSFAENADHSIVSRAWNDKKISAHHAIIPTTVCPNYTELSEMERNLYDLVARAYIAQFYPPQEFLTTKIDVSVGAEQFTASGKVILQDGWKVLYQREREESAEADADEVQNLPAVHEGDPVHFADGNVQEGVTKPPPRFTPATLLKAMKEIHKYVKDKELKETLKECSGIGTEATRAEVIEIIQKRGYVRLSKNFFVPDEIGISLCQILPEQIIFPDITARWENDLDAISRGSMSVKDFSAQQEIYVRELLENAKTSAIAPPKNVVKCPTCGKAMLRRKGAKGFFWACTGYPECKTTLPDKNGKPDTAPKSSTRKGRKF